VQTIDDVGLCGAQLGPTADLYGTALATDDMAAVLDALGIGQVDLYGDSYGTWFSQAFAVNYPEHVRGGDPRRRVPGDWRERFLSVRGGL